MRRKILIVLFLSAAVLYSYAAFMLAGGSFSSTPRTAAPRKREELPFDKLVLNTVPVKFESTGRDPFRPYKEVPVKQAVSPVKAPARNIPPKDPPKPPLITITGIMWNPSKPIAMINMPDGASAVARPGSVIGNVTFKKIEQNRIQVVSDGKEFWINR